MSASDELTEFRQNMAALCAGKEEAAWRLTEKYGPHVMRVIRNRKGRRMQSKHDTVDFLQMVWQSFFRNRERIAKLQSPDELMRFLATLAKHKVTDEARRQFQTEKYDVSRERGLEEAADLSQDESTPYHVAIVRECWKQILAGQTERNQQIAKLRLQGMTYVEIADVVGIHERTVRQVMEDLLNAYQARVKATQ